MDKITTRQRRDYSNGYLSKQLYLPSIFNFFDPTHGAIYKPRTTMDEFFGDRPWLKKDRAMYEEYIKEDFRLKDLEIRKDFCIEVQ